MLIAVFSLAGVQLIDGTRTFRNDWLVWIMIVGMLLIPIFLDLKEAYLERKNARNAFRLVLDSDYGNNAYFSAFVQIVSGLCLMIVLAIQASAVAFHFGSRPFGTPIPTRRRAV